MKHVDNDCFADMITIHVQASAGTVQAACGFKVF